MRPFVSSADVQKLDFATLQNRDISSFELMKEVAAEMALHFKSHPRLRSGKIIIFCGPGNNGGDGYCLAEFLRRDRRDVSVLTVDAPKSTECRRAQKFFKGPTRTDISKCEIVVDAIYGASGRPDLNSKTRSLVDKLNAQKAFRVAIDVPTAEFQAHLTMTVAWPKLSFLSDSVAKNLGQVIYIGSDFAQPSSAKFWALEPSDFSLPARKPAGFKTLYGRCAVVGGSASMPGAALLAAEAAHRVGAGYSTIYFAEGRKLNIRVRDASALFKMKWTYPELKKESALVLGCGGFVKNFRWPSITLPMVIDADALRDSEKFKKLRAPAILTPHLGEAARILGISTAEVMKDRLESLNEISKQTRQSVYLKGAPGILKFSDENKFYVNLSINPTFSKAGSGDILSGILGGLLTQMWGRGARISTKSPSRLGDGEMAVRGRSTASRMTHVTSKSPSRLGDGGDITPEFRRAIWSGLVFQAEIGEVLREFEGAIATDQLEVFSTAFKRLRVTSR